ncbi:MAG TPA: DNA-directed RNA polymerase subunit alpha C-terminal domain-containing protein [Lacipirellulaceae bacterium]|nr:DNA-directed RNA polymerase subunit alpha C-terminal domain-containing protein [Lacipirellulaceae bacterium]
MNESTNNSSPLDLRYSLPVWELGLAKRTLNGLLDQKIQYVGQLVERSERSLLGLGNIGRAGIEQIKSSLAARGLSLATTVLGRARSDEDFIAQLAANERGALELDKAILAGRLAPAALQQGMGVLAEAIECLSQQAFRQDLKALVGRYKRRLAQDPQ